MLRYVHHCNMFIAWCPKRHLSNGKVGEWLCVGVECTMVAKLYMRVCAYMSERDAKEGHVRFACKNTSEHIAK
jgi:hypothetical protein